MAAKTSQATLALEFTAHGAAKGWRANEHLVDALPYVDSVPPELKPHVEALIEEEKRKSIKLPSDYLREMPAVRAPKFDDHPVLKTEYERVRNKEPMAPLDAVRYRLEPPPQARRGDVGAWRLALDNAGAQLEHQHLRILNQELLLKYGDKAWRAQVSLDEAAVRGLEAQLAALRKETDALNRERKLQQHAAGSELSKLERQYLSQVRKNADIERACDRLEEAVAALEAELDGHIRADTAAAEGGAPAAAEGQQGAGTAEGAGEQAAGDGKEAAGDGNGDTEMADGAAAGAAAAEGAAANGTHASGAES
ncbi:hypothetical protein HYH02_013342 [Chlamydomonas schloesseri]|uniref:Pre-mRNA-splicing factor SPF27 n=1 Tax=Chlamydomonas schloesseri TaxID=2026947 RepID=A0A835VVX6_9CHLO|nr:hypothetical protein HYH02_013342 [Chlamydomonas schloesseri]|eukprot:KAG2431352.1 hypothetical protein HYH02_013342 [Chlamydomonas schloesseri]